MAYEYDQLGNVIGEYESEEERKRRMDAEQAETPVKQTITTNPDGTQEMTIKGTPQSLSSMNPNTPTVSGPITPEETFKRMQQIESGNRDFDATGKPIQSPAGAMYKNQVMPATARDPGFGVIPARDNSPEEFNRVGQDLFGALVKQFGGDTQKAAAAYNAGYGRVSKNVAANQGQMNVAQLPKETQGYLAKLGNMVGSVIPSAEAKTVPQTPANVGSSGFEPYDRNRPGNAAYEGGVPTYDRNRPGNAPFTGGASVPQPDSVINNQAAAFEAKQQPLNLPDDPFQQYLKLQDSPKDLLSYSEDLNNPENLRHRSNERAIEILTNKNKEMQAKNVINGWIQSGDQKSFGDAIQGRGKKNELTDWLQIIALGYISPELAGKKAIDMGLVPTKWEDGTLIRDGQEIGVQLERNALGKLVGGETHDGKRLTAGEISSAQTRTLPKGVHVTKTDTFIDPESGQVVNHQILSNSKERWTAGGELFTGDKSKLVLENSFTAAENTKVANVRKNLEAKYPVPTPEQLASSLSQAGLPKRRIETELGLAPGTLSKQGVNPPTPADLKVAPQPAPQPAQGPNVKPQAEQVTDAQAQPNMDAAFNTASVEFRPPNPGEKKEVYEAAKKRHGKQSELDIKRAEEFKRASITVRDRLADVKQAVAAVQSGNHYMGPLLGQEKSKILPGVQEFFGSKFGDQTSMNNTTMMRSLMTKEGLQGIKDSMGPQISNFDVQAWLKGNAIQENSSPEQFLQYYTRLHNQLFDLAQVDRQNAVRYGQLNPDFNFGERLPDFRTNPAGPPSAAKKKENSKVDTNNPLLK